MSWKIIAWIFIILFILETAFMFYAWKIGSDTINNELECSNRVCLDYDAFIYDDSQGICYCYIDNEISKKEYIK